ncbi:MAG TPA: hypothetical protein VJR89_04415 [Polyangiales bacterium]|nr:hypothetical protein [Polyangiales bacterium]
MATATAELAPAAHTDGATGSPITGIAMWRATRAGVDLTLKLTSCGGPNPYAVEILTAPDCSAASLKAPAWPRGRGERIPLVHCTGFASEMPGVMYARSAKDADAWEISELVGHAVVLRDRSTGEVRACGVISRGPDAVVVPLPPANEAPGLEARAAIAGICFGRQFAGAGPDCPVPAALVECVDLHCDLGSCLQTCAEYARCLDMQTDVCDATPSCEMTQECANCQGAISACQLGFCPEYTTCVPPITPDGACSRVEHCCAMQGDGAAACLSVFQALVTWGGDVSCSANMHDLGAVTLLQVPCTYQRDALFEPPAPSAPSTTESAASPRLPTGTAGLACTDDADCPGGRCERGAADPSANYCTRACSNIVECGEGGICAAVADADAPRLCLARCVSQGDCREGFLCTGASSTGRSSIPGACRPNRGVDRLVDGLVGRACDDDSACSGGECATANLLGTSYPGNYCTARCYEDRQCGSGGVCLWPNGSINAGHCLQQCESDADCKRSGYRCWKFGDGTRVFRACYPGNAPLLTTGMSCTTAESCGAAPARCASELPFAVLPNEMTSAPDGYCTQDCSHDEECGPKAQCIAYGETGGICLTNCDDSTACRAGYACSGHLRDATTQVCIPNHPSTLTDAGAGQ